MKRRTYSSSAGRTLAFIVTLSFATWWLRAQPVPRLDSASIEWIQKGTTVDVRFAGTNLGQVTGIIFDGERGLSATNIPSPPPSRPSITLQTVSGSAIASLPTGPSREETRFRAQITAAEDAALGMREVRAITPLGISNPLRINVGQWPELTETEPNNTLEQAQTITFPAAISGVVSASTEVDGFKFTAKKGEEIVVEVDTAGTGSPLDSSLAILDISGKELIRNEDYDGLDSVVQFNVPADGQYVIQLRDFRYQGGGNYKYRLYAGPLPFVESIFPFGGQRGSKVEVALRGRNLEGTTKMALGIAPDAPMGRQEIRASTSRGFSNPIEFDVKPWPESIEAEPNNALDKANSLNAPGVANGQIAALEDVDYFKFKSDKDQKLVCEVIASQFGSWLDPLLILQDNKGAILQQNDDTAGADARIEFDAKKDQEYILAVRDLTEGGGDGYGYRLAVRPPSPAASPNFSAVYLPESIRVHRLGVSGVRCEVNRLAGFAGPVRFDAENLPSGVVCEPLVISESAASGLMVITAGKDAVLGTVPFRVVATATIDGKATRRNAEGLAGNAPVKAGYLTVLDEAPFTLQAITLTSATEQDGRMPVEVLAQRRDGFTGDIKLTAEGFSAGREPISKSLDTKEVILKGTESLAKLSLKAKLDSEVGTRTVVVRGEAIVEGHPMVEHTRPFPLTVAQIPFVISSTMSRLSVTILPKGSESAAGETATVIKADRRAGFDGEIVLALQGMPEGIKAELPNIAAKTGEVTLKISATDKAVPGTNTFTVLGTGTHNNYNYKRSTDKVTLVVSLPESSEPIKPPPTAAAAASTVPPAGTK